MSVGILRGRDRYAVAVVLLIVTMVLLGMVGDRPWGRGVVLAVQGLTLLFILRTSDVDSRVLRVAAFLVVVAVAASGILIVTAEHASAFGAVVVGTLMVLLAPAAVIRRLLRQERISIQTVFGALCLYLLVGLFFAYGFALLHRIGPGFFAQISDPRSVDFLYFSFVTLATLGYGDLTPVTDLGRMVAVSEALIGQLYLVSVVALLVSNVGRVRALGRASPGGPEEPRSEADS